MFLKRARQLRINSTKSEQLMWMYLRSHRIDGYKFKRQQVIGNYIVDFVCFQEKLIIEVDGGQHASQIPYDSKRTEWLEGRGFCVMRFWNNDVLANTSIVMDVIFQKLQTLKNNENNLGNFNCIRKYK